MEIGIDFNDILSYNTNMTKGIEDKLWFVNYINKNKKYVFVDFGCADGTLINILSQIPGYRDNAYIGYDISDTMVDLAKTKFSWEPWQDVTFVSTWDKVISKMNSYKKYNKVLILSSVLHEVYSYCNEHEINEFWERVLKSGFDYIYVRDMMVSKDSHRKSDPHDIELIKETINENNKVVSKKQIAEFENNFGPLTDNHNLIHFLLKYRWKINWDREVKENYFSILIEDFLEKMSSNYNLNYFERFRVPFLDSCIAKDFYIKLNDYTHIKAFFEIKKN